MDLKKPFFHNIFSGWSLIGLFSGIIGGFAYYHFVGCQSGSCAITSNPWLSMLWGAAVGYLLGDMLKRKQIPAKDASTEGQDN